MSLHTKTKPIKTYLATILLENIEVELKAGRRHLTSLERALCQKLLTIGHWRPDLELASISSFSTLQLSFELQVAEMHRDRKLSSFDVT